jgi:hypothetical protein
MAIRRDRDAARRAARGDPGSLSCMPRVFRFDIAHDSGQVPQRMTPLNPSVRPSCRTSAAWPRSRAAMRGQHHGVDDYDS